MEHSKNTVVPMEITRSSTKISAIEDDIKEPSDTQIIQINPNKTLQQKLKKIFMDNILLIMTIIAVAVGVGLGFLLRAVTDFNKPTQAYFGFPGEMFLRALKFIILPLISSSLITGLKIKLYSKNIYI